MADKQLNTEKVETFEEYLQTIKPKLPSLKYSDWHINQQYSPEDPEEEDYEEYWAYQEKLCKNGFFMEDVYISGFLYWHLNFWKTEVTKLDDFGNTYEHYTQPSFRDNEWLIADGIARAKHAKKGLAIGGSRRISKSVTISSFLSYNSSLDAHSQNLFVGLNGDDISVTTKKVSSGLDEIPLYFQWMRIKENWLKEVTLGIKTSAGSKKPFSQIFIRNIENGKNEEAIAGTKPRSLVIEEALSADSLVYTLDGPKFIKDIKIGELVYGSDGQLAQVLDKIDVGVTKLYEFTFKDGRKVKASGDHVWKLHDKNLGEQVKITTSELLEHGYEQYSVKNPQPIEYPEKDLPEDPYSFGLNCTGSIPEMYLRGSVEQRRALMHGLLDAKIEKQKQGTFSFCHFKSFEDLARGLGLSIDKQQSSHIFRLQSNIDEYCPLISIVEVEPGEAHCLKVDNQDQTFLTNDYTVTGNCGKGKFLRGFKAAVPGFTSPHGWVCSPLLIFTGGDMEKYHDAKNVFMNPYSHNFLEYDCLEGKRDAFGRLRKHGLFLGNKYRQEAKRLITFGEYLGIEDPNSDLFNIPFWVSDEGKANRILEEELEKLKTNPDKMLYHKEVMYFPKTVDDIFLNVGANMYNTKACLQQQLRLEELGITGLPVDLYSDGEKICWKESEKEYIREWPVETQNKDAPIMIYEFPETHKQKFLYVAGVDPYRQDSSDSSESLGAVYIYKRMHSLTGEGLRETFVASYVARPDSQEEWEENARMLLMFYNAYALVENDEYSFCKYMKTKGNAELYLCPQPKIYNTLVVNGKQDREFGLSRQSKKVREYLNNLLKRYMDETLSTIIDDNGVLQKEIKGVTRILDHTLLTELIGFAPDVNVDRQVAASLALAMALELDPLLGTAIGQESKNKQESMNKAFDKAIKKTKTFSAGGSTFSRAGHKTFRR